MTKTYDTLLECRCSPIFQPEHFRVPVWHHIALTRYRVDIYGRVWDVETASFVNCPDGRFSATIRSQNGHSVGIVLMVSTMVRSCWWNADLAVIEKSSFKDAILKGREYHEAVDQLDRDPVQLVVFEDKDHAGYHMCYRWDDGALFTEYSERAAGRSLKQRHETVLHEALIAHYDKIPDELKPRYLSKLPRSVKNDLLKKLNEGTVKPNLLEKKTVHTVTTEPVKVACFISVKVYW